MVIKLGVAGRKRTRVISLFSLLLSSRSSTGTGCLILILTTFKNYADWSNFTQKDRVKSRLSDLNGT
jgi:hypothetical protein